ncbi:MAG: hypothetical protein NTW48_00020 [Chloroflexi bacterium]|nr:hypothetical protein [Chloroflexota bacterium]
MKKWSVLLIIAVVALLMPMSTAMVNAQEEASLSINKSANKDSATVGETITYTYTITNNTDNVTFTNISLEDDKLGLIPLNGSDNITLAPGVQVTATATYTVAQADLPGPIENTATVSGTDPDSNPVTASATATVLLSYSPDLQITKEANRETASPEDTITYTYTIVNNGDATVSNISLEDDKLGLIPLNGSDNITLAPGEKITATATYTVLEEDLEQGSIINTATVTGTDPDGITVTSDASETVDLTYTASLQVTKETDRETASFKETINYTYTITNTGDVSLSKITLADDKIPEVSLTSDNITLAPGDSITATGTYTVSIGDFLLKSTIVNTADVTGTDPQGKLVTASAKATVSINKTLFWKRDILQQSGVPGKGIEKAPGLQKPFNPKSQAAEHAGKKDEPKPPEQLQIRERTENQSTENQLQIRSEVENQAGSGQATQSDDEARPGNGQLKKNSVTDNQTQGQEATQGNGQNKPDKDKPKNKSKAGNQP